ncbi:MAG: ZPR1-type zinc finger protein [Thermoprotei archaeon]
MNIDSEVFTIDAPCSACGLPQTEARRVVYSSPEEFEILVFICPRCGYRESYISDLTVKRPVKYTIHVNTISDLNTLVYRSPSADIVIPELGLEINHTGHTRAKITTIEGVLLEAKEHVEALFGQNEAALFLSESKAALQARINFTFILSDDTGASWVKAGKGTDYHVDYLQNT